MKTLKEKVEFYKPIQYKKLTRNDTIYKDGEEFVVTELARLTEMYVKPNLNAMSKRLIRDNIDFLLRRWHGFNIESRIGGHYVEEGLIEKGIFEHVIPAKYVRDMLISGILTIEQSINTPACRISNESDKLLRKNGLVSSSPNPWVFFERYKDLGIKIQTHDKKSIDVATWNLDDHFSYFSHLKW